MRKLLTMPDLKPDVIIGIGHYLYAVERLPLITTGINVGVTIDYTTGNSERRGSHYFVLSINEETFHIEESGYEYEQYIGGDSIGYPGWYIERSGGRDTEMDLEKLENEIDEYLNLGTVITVEDYSEIDL